MTAADKLQTDADALSEDAKLNTDEGFQEAPEEKKSRTMLVVLAVAAVVMIFAVVVIFYASKNLNENESAEIGDEVEVAAVIDPEEPSSDLDAEIYVVKESDWHHYNGNIDADGNPVDPSSPSYKKPTGNQVATTANAADATPATSNAFSLAGLVGLDEDDAHIQAKAAGYVSYSVYVCDTNAVKSGTAAPKAGLVLGTTTYTMRNNGQQHLFLLVATSDPYSKAALVPNVVGQQWKDARASLQSAGIGTRYAYENQSVDTKGKVLFQAAPAGSYIPRGSTNILVLAHD